MKSIRIIMVLMLVGILVAGCSQEAEMTAPVAQTGYDKDGQNTLGPPEIPIADGSGFLQGGVGMVDTDTGNFDITVPAGAEVVQVLLYWVGGTTGDNGDDTISVNGNPVTGAMVHDDPINFFGNYNFYGYRADITAKGWVGSGLNSFEITDFDFDFSAGTLDENNGASILVIYDDGSEADLSVVDGLDMAFFQFLPPLDATVAQTFYFDAESEDRLSELVVFAGSVGENRPNEIRVTTSGEPQIFVMGSTNGPLWDSMLHSVIVPAGDTELTVQLISIPSTDPLGASMGWIASGLSVPVTPPRYCLGDFVWFDENNNGCQDAEEMGAENVVVHLWYGCTPGGDPNMTTTTDAAGYYEFCDLLPGDYTVQFGTLDGYVFCDQYALGCDPADDSNAGENGFTDCITIVDADDWTIDAGLCMPPQDGCTLTIGFWKTHAGFGPQDDVLSMHLPIYLGDMGGTKTLDVTTAAIAVDVLKMKTYGTNSNGITKLYAQLLAAKLNFASGASDGAVADYVTDADAFLADHDYMDWDGLSDDDKDMVMMWQGSFDDYNNGYIGPGHCEDDDDDDEEPVMFR